MEKKKSLNILFLGGAKRVSLAQAMIAAGDDLGFNVHIFSYELYDDAPISIVGEIIIGLKWNDSDILAHLYTTVVDNNIDMVVPFLDPATIIAAKFKDFCRSADCEVFIPVSSVSDCQTFFDKRETEEWCLNEGISYPLNDGSLPMIQKPINGSASKGITIIKTLEDLQTVKKDSSLLIQKFIDGQEISVDIYRSFLDDEIKVLVPRVRLETQGGESIKSRTISNQKVIDFASDVINKTNLLGPLTLQVLVDHKTDEIYFMELNPRFGGAVLTSIGAGANIPEYLIKDFLSVGSEVCCNWKSDVTMIRYFKEVFLCK